MVKFNPSDLLQDFKILEQTINDEPLVYLDNAATTQKPKQVLERILYYYEWENSNVHRGVHTLGERATSAYEGARETVRKFLNARLPEEIIFTRGTTTSLNYLAQSLAEFVQPGDEIVISIMEHHANILPWQRLVQKRGALLKYIEIKNGELDLELAATIITKKTKIVALTHISNVLGTINPVSELTSLAHSNSAFVVLDAAQSAPHMALDVQKLAIDFMAFSGHKMLAPTGIGVLFGKAELLEKMQPVELGGEMIDFVDRQSASWAELPWKFEAGTPNIAGAIGLATAIDYLTAIGLEKIAEHGKSLAEYLIPKLQKIEGLTLYGTSDLKKRSALFSFNLANLHPHDVATALDAQGIAVRAGHHCAKPLIEELKTPATLRASFYLYNTQEDCDKLVEAILATKEFFSHGTL